MEKFIKAYNKLMSYIGLICLCGFIISVTVQVFSRTFLPKTPSWTEEAARYLFIYMVAFGCSVAVHQNEFVGIDMFTSHLPGSLTRIINLLINITLFLFSGFVLTRSVSKFAFLKFRMVSTAMEIPMQYVYFSMVLLFGLLTFSYFLESIWLIVCKKTDGQGDGE